MLKSHIPKLKNLSQIARSMRLVYESSPFLTIATLALLLFQSLLPLITLYLTKLVIDLVTLNINSDADPQVFFNQLVQLILALIVVALAEILINSLAAIVSEAQTQLVIDYVSDLIHRRSITVDLSFYENAQYHDTLHRAQLQGPYRPKNIVQNLILLMRNVVSLVGIIVLIGSVYWFSPILLFFATLPRFIVRMKFSQKLHRWVLKTTPLQRNAEINHWLLTSEIIAKELRLFDLGLFFIDRYNKLRKELRTGYFQIAVHRSIQDSFTQGIGVIAIFVLYGFLAFQTLLGMITVGSLVMYFQAFQRGLNLLKDMITSLSDLYEDTLFISNLYLFLDLQPKLIAPAKPAPIPQAMKEGFRFENVTFKYDSGTQPVLEDINIVVGPGEIIALVGDNGAGKSTLIKLLCRLYDPTSGRITLDGTDLRNYDPIALRQQISATFQDYVRYPLSAVENIWLADVSQPQDLNVIRTAARQAGIDETIAGLPNGYETILGNIFEEGRELSVGQWQKVALARAFMRNPQLVILDEPSSALDVMSEHEIFARFRNIIGGRSAILISHRLSTVKMADRIYVLDQCRITEEGSHSDLMRENGKYAQMFKTQSEYYREGVQE